MVSSVSRGEFLGLYSPGMLTLYADVDKRAFVPRECDDITVDSLDRVQYPVDDFGELYWSAYDPGVAWGTRAESIADMQASFDGEYGRLWPEASFVAVQAARPVGLLLVVESAPWPDVLPGPFVIELFTARTVRRRGVAAELLRRGMEAVGLHGQTSVGLRVVPDNHAARSLYDRFGFTERPSP